MTNQNRAIIQLVYGIALIVTGIGIIYMIPQKMMQLKEFGHFSMFFVRFCFYLWAVILIGGGIKKIYNNYRKPEDNTDSNP